MGIFSYLWNVYDLDTLDTRFTNASAIPYKTVIESRDDAVANRERAAKWKQNSQPSKWNTPEFYFYFAGLSFIIPFMFWVCYEASKTTHPRYPYYERLLKPGWIPGRKIDASDSQYNTFRSNIPYMFALLVFHPLLRRLYNAIVYPVKAGQGSRPTPEEADKRLNQRASYDFGFALIYLVALHGVSAFKILLILYMNHRVATTFPRKYIPAGTWVFNIGILFANELCRGYRFGEMAVWIFGPPIQNNLVDSGSTLVAWGRWLDGYGGLMSRWEILFNITVLRLISFNLDYYWSLDRRSYSTLEKKQVDPTALSERDRVAISGHPKDYSFRNYVAYAIYAPLYLTGPIITFNDFISQSRYRSASIETSRTIRYAVRFALCLLAMEVILHYNYIQAISKARPEWGAYTPTQLSVLSFMNLHMVWLKLLLPWRLFRLWALVDGVDPPENLIRCVSDNWSTLAFWRSWHRSFYRWSLRYIYVPLGGSSFRTGRDAARSILTYVLVFTFVALWHDIQLHLLIWGWLVVLFMLPEMAAGYVFPKRKWENKPTAYRMICCVGAVVNTFMMITANLVGFAVGVDGLKMIAAGIFKDFAGVCAIFGAGMALFVGVQVMFEVRESEARRGINVKC